ncbi:MAG: endonuclease domain-containing protein, partial [Solirubrobacterales bacterium]
MSSVRPPASRDLKERPFLAADHRTFRFTRVWFDQATVTAHLEYALDEEITFEERIAFPGDAALLERAEQPAFAEALRLLHLIAGVSYFKTAAPPAIVVETGRVSALEAKFLTALYRNGLAEFAWVNHLNLREHRWFEPTGEATGPVLTPELERRTLVPIGGGKDSIVSLETLRGAGEPAVPFAVGMAMPLLRTIERSGVTHVGAERTLSANLVDLNNRGALNGHVPVTAVVSAIAVTAAVLHGFDTIAMSNERSASSGSFHWHGMDVNHQWSKGIEFETAFRATLERAVPGLDYFSLLRPASELSIARAFAGLTDYHDVFTSCNRVFRRDPARRGAGWCTDCPKCRFVFLILAPFLEPGKLSSIFGRDMLADLDQLDGFRALMGLGANKPFECVG